MSLRIIVLAKQVPDTRNVGKDAMKEVGDKMDVSLRETGVGGVAGTPAAQEVVEKLGM